MRRIDGGIFALVKFTEVKLGSLRRALVAGHHEN